MVQLASSLPHRRPTRAIHFPAEAEVPETKLHFKLRTALYAILELAFASKARIGSDQFIYWNARDPKRCLAPDVFVRCGERDCDFDSWKTWERGTPELAIEILSADEDWDDKLARYHELGVTELVSFDPSHRTIRAWDRLEGDLVEREVVAGSTPCVTLGGQWVVAAIDGTPALRLARDSSGKRLFLTPTEHEAARRRKAERRVATLEAKLAKRRRRKR